MIKLLEGSNRRSRWTLILSLLVAGVLLFLAFRGVSWNEMFKTVRQGRVGYLVLACLIQSVSYLMRALRWRFLLSPEKWIAPRTVFWAIVVGYLGNNFMPARAGDFIRSVVIGRAAGMSKSYCLATIFIERIVDVMFLVVISLIALMFLEGMPGWLFRVMPTMVALGLVGMVVLFAMPRLEPWFKKGLGRMHLPDSWHIFLGRILEKFLLGMRVFHNRGRALNFIGLTVVVWLIDAFFAKEVASAFDLKLTLVQALLLLAALGLSSAIPSTPGYIGIFQFVAVTVLVPFDFTRSEALVYIIAYQAVHYAVVTVWGAIGLWKLRARGAALNET
jgi:glycosyltransferase 2 family protein